MYYVPQESGDAEMLAERISPRLQHANSAVVLNATKVMMYLMNYMSSEEYIHQLCRKLAPPLGKKKGCFNLKKRYLSLYSYITCFWI